MPLETTPLFLSADRSEALASWFSHEPSMVSLHLPVDAAGAYPALLDRLVREAPFADARLRGLERDLERLTRYVRGQFVPAARRGLCAFSCAKQGVFEVFSTPEPVKAGLAVAERPDLRPLAALAGDHPRFLVLLADERRARLLEIYLHEASELEDLEGDFSGAAVAGLAARAETLSRRRRADRFVLGSDPVFASQLSAHLPPEIKKNLILEPLLGPDRPVEAVTDRIAHNERQARKLRQSVLVQRFLDELRQGGAVAGLEASTSALQQGCVKLLLIQDNYAKMGRCCPACGRLSVDHRNCPWCFRPTDALLDLVAELADRALAAGIEVFRVRENARFDQTCPIGVELGAPISAPRPAVPTSRALRARYATKDGRASPLRPRR
ncbi:MAG: hypothetical protein A2V88_12780 [Elusimicrobia bacterium RBG_16_66_12]|nr:MAG: hypothetical protein A2V88_12780 [Elusimicrobia bacterium RBG_16_66_12]